MTKAEFLLELEQIMELRAGALSGDEKLESLERWDSFAQIAFIAMMDAKVGQRVTGADLEKAHTVHDLANLAGSKVSW